MYVHYCKERSKAFSLRHIFESLPFVIRHWKIQKLLNMRGKDDGPHLEYGMNNLMSRLIRGTALNKSANYYYEISIIEWNSTFFLKEVHKLIYQLLWFVILYLSLYLKPIELQNTQFINSIVNQSQNSLVLFPFPPSPRPRS